MLTSEKNNNQSPAKRNKYLVAAINNKLAFFNEYQQYDSTIYYAKIGLGLDSLEPKRMAYLKANLAEALFYKNSSKAALPLINESLKLLSAENYQDPDIQDRIREVLRVKALLLAGQHEFAKSNECLFTAYQIMQQRFRNRYTGKVLIALSNNFLALNKTDSAIFYAHKALSTVVKIDSVNIFSLPAIKDLYPENTIEESADALADAFVKKYGETSDIQFAIASIDCYNISFAVENKLLNYYQYDDSKLAVLEESRNRSEKAIGLCYKLLQKTKDKKWAQKAYEFAEGNKSTVLLQSLKKNIAANNLLQNDSLYQKLQSLQLQAAYTETSIAQKKLTNDSSLKNEQQKADKINNDIIRTSSLLLKNNPVYKEVLQKNDSLNLSLVQQKILKDDSTAILEFFTGTNAMYAFVFSKNNAVQVMEYDSSLLPVINTYIQFFIREDAIASNPKAFENEAFMLYQKLGLQNIISIYNHLIILPDGIFSFIPFESLLYKESSSLSLKSLPYFINKCNISYGFSASTLLKQTEQKINDGTEMLAMAPLFTNNKKGLAPLPGTAAELKSVQTEMSNGNYFISDKATINTFRKYCKDAAYIHLATHAFANTSGAEPEIEFADSALTLNEIYARPLHANLAVLSACNTGIGTLQKGEGFISLARGFYYAGVPHIITSLWQVNDASTNGLFKNFYAAMQNDGYENAFHKSKIKYLESNQSPEKYSPYYWAGFIFIGNDDMPPASHSMIYIIAVMLFSFGAYFLWMRRK